MLAAAPAQVSNAATSAPAPGVMSKFMVRVPTSFFGGTRLKSRGIRHRLLINAVADVLVDTFELCFHVLY